MSVLRERIESMKSESIINCNLITKDKFLDLFVSLRPHFDLDDEDILKLFEITDEEKEGAINADQAQRILDTILSIEEPNIDDQEPDSEINNFIDHLRQSGKLTRSQNRTRRLTYAEPGNPFIAHKNPASFDPNEISEIKDIFEICESGKGHVSLEQIKNFVKEYNLVSCTVERVMEIFNLIKEEIQEDIIIKETFFKRISEFERDIINSHPQDKIEVKTQEHEAFYKPSYHLEDSNEAFSEGLEQEIKLILEKVDLAVDQINRRVNERDIIAILAEIPFMVSHLGKKMKQNEDLYKEQNEKILEYKRFENQSRGRIGDLEMKLNSQKEFIEEIQCQYDALYEKNQELELKVQVQEHLKTDLKNKNNEIATLERKIRQIGLQSEELKNQVDHIQGEKEFISKNCKELQTLLEQLDKDDDTHTRATRLSSWSNSTMEIELYKSELSNKTKDFEKEKEYFNKIINELETRLENSRTFIDEIRCEKVRIQEELKALQEKGRDESFMTHRKDTNNSLRMHFGEDNETILKNRRVTNQPSNLGDSWVILKRGLDSCTFDSKDPAESWETEEKIIPSPENTGLYPIYENGDEEDKQQKGKILHHANTAPVINESSIISYQRIEHNLRNLSKDYLSIRHNNQIMKILKENKEGSGNAMCFSDYIYTINSKEQRKHRIIFITDQNLYCLHPKRNYEVQMKIPLESIYQITVITSSAGLCRIHVKNWSEYHLIDSYKRRDLILYLQEIFKVNGVEPFSIVYQEKLLEAASKHILSKQTQFSKTFMNPELQSSFKNAVKCGELYVKTEGIFSSIKKYFFVLTNVGLVSFKNSGEKKPIDFIPVIDYSLIDLPNMGDDKYWFELKFPYSDYEVQLAAESDLEKREWMLAVRNVQKKDIKI